jgi:hypothetical protein
VKLTLVPCAFANHGRLCAEGMLDGAPLAASKGFTTRTGTADDPPRRTERDEPPIGKQAMSAIERQRRWRANCAPANLKQTPEKELPQARKPCPRPRSGAAQTWSSAALVMAS